MTTRQSYATTTAAVVAFISSGILLFLDASPARAQLAPPAVSMHGTAVQDLPLSPAEAGYHVRARRSRLITPLGFDYLSFPRDSIQHEVAAAAAQWLVEAQRTPIRGIQLDPSGRIGIVANQVQYAQRQFAERLATPGLSAAAKAYTLVAALQAFADPAFPERLPIAEHYLAQLNALGDTVAIYRWLGEQALVQAYYLLGRSDDVVRHGVHAIEQLPTIPYQDRLIAVYPNGIHDLYIPTVDALTGQPGGQAKIDRLNTILRQEVKAPSAIVALDSEYLDHQRASENELSIYLRGSALLGTKGAPIVSNYWLNRPTRDSATVPVDDGRIHVLLFASYNCPGCITVSYTLQRLKRQFPDIEPIFVTNTDGFWGNRLVPVDTEIAQLNKVFLDHLHLTLPIAIWKATKATNVDGGYTPIDGGPNWRHYPYVSKPTVWVVDGRGIIRHLSVGSSPEAERQLGITIQFLRREAAARTHLSQ